MLNFTKKINTIEPELQRKKNTPEFVTSRMQNFKWKPVGNEYIDVWRKFFVGPNMPYF